jgi:hypothetical protein
MQTICSSPTEYVSGDPSLVISYPFVSHPGTVVTCKEPGDLKWVSMGLRLPPYVSIQEVTVWYQISNPDPQTPPNSLISQIRLTEMKTPDRATVLHDDGTDLTSTIPTAHTSKVGGKIPTLGSSVTLSLRLNFQNTTDTILLGAVEVIIEPVAECSFNVRDFGAKGDWPQNPSADDTSSLQAAFDAVPPSGAVICVPPGIYVVSKTLALRSKTHLKGAGSATVFRRNDSGPDIDVIFNSKTVTDVTVEAISIDINGAKKIPPKKSFAVGLGFREQCSNIRIRDTRVFDSTGTNVCCRLWIMVLESDHVWIERNYLTDGLRLGAGGAGDKLITQNNPVEDANDNAITISTAAYSAQTINYIIRDNIVRAAKGCAIYIGDDGFGAKPEDALDPSIKESQIICRNILVDGNLLLGPLEKDQVFVLVKLANYTERLHIVNNVMVNPGSEKDTFGVTVSIQTKFGRAGFDFLIAHNTLDGTLGTGIWVRSLERVRIVQNQLSNGISDSSGIKIGGDGDADSVDVATVQGNVVSEYGNGIYVENSTKVDVIGNSLDRMSAADHGALRLRTLDGEQLSALVLGNRISDNTGAGISEEGPGTFDTHYIFNDLRSNAGGAFSGINANATRLGNLGTEEYILRHISGIAPWDPPPLDNGSSTSTTVNVGGARVGDTVTVGFNRPIPDGAILAAAVTADNTAKVTLLNMTGGSFDLPNGLIRVDVWRH